MQGVSAAVSGHGAKRGSGRVLSKQSRGVLVTWIDPEADKRRAATPVATEKWRFDYDDVIGGRSKLLRVQRRIVDARNEALEPLKHNFWDSADRRVNLTEMSQFLHAPRNPPLRGLEARSEAAAPPPRQKASRPSNRSTDAAPSLRIEVEVEGEHGSELVDATPHRSNSSADEGRGHDAAPSPSEDDDVKAIYELHPSDVSRLPVLETAPGEMRALLPRDIVDPSDQAIKRLDVRQPRLFFHLFICGFPFGPAQAVRIISGLLRNVSVTLLSGMGETPNVHSGAQTLICSVAGISPRRLARLNRTAGSLARELSPEGGVVHIRVFGITTEEPRMASRDIQDSIRMQTSVVLRGIDPKSLDNIASRFAGDAPLMFPNYINFDQLGLGPAAGVFSGKVSVDIGGLLLSGETDAAAKAMIRRMTKVNFMLSHSEEDLDDPNRSVFSARFYGNIPKKYAHVKLFIDEMQRFQDANKFGPNRKLKNFGTTLAFLNVAREATHRFAHSAAATAWNYAAKARIGVNPMHAIPGDHYIAEGEEGDSIRTVRTPEEGQRIGLEHVVIPTLSASLRFSDWPESCGGSVGFSTALRAAGIDPEGFHKSPIAKSFLAPSVPRRVTALAEGVECTIIPDGAFTQYVQKHDQQLMKIPDDVMRKVMPGGDVRFEMYPEPWRCIPCGETNPPSGIRCGTCGDHKYKLLEDVGGEAALFSHAFHSQATVQLSAVVPADASFVSFLSENFKLSSFVKRRDQPHIKDSIAKSFSVGSRAISNRRRGGRSQRKGEKTKKKKKKAMEGKDKAGRGAPPQLPQMLQEKTFPEMRFAHPTSPVARPELVRVDKIFRVGNA
eukprot:TRINITY_DN16875_c0_g1_i1.p1 TRINITY_DN16875_c0_g1~~TRINITY_DN16875_c0_g1_i1.p1  ORF type:complete len:838 (+),score=245.07 TRINITY_DN16875_c0_g1_i1:78-2591(+)